MDSYMSKSFLSKNIQGTWGFRSNFSRGWRRASPWCHSGDLSVEQSWVDARARGPVLARGRGRSEASAHSRLENAFAA